MSLLPREAIVPQGDNSGSCSQFPKDEGLDRSRVIWSRDVPRRRKRFVSTLHALHLTRSGAQRVRVSECHYATNHRRQAYRDESVQCTRVYGAGRALSHQPFAPVVSENEVKPWTARKEKLATLGPADLLELEYRLR